MCVEVTRANAGGRYGRRSIETKQEAGFVVPGSLLDSHYNTLWLGRPCADCRCTSPETCLTLQDLGVYCENHGGITK